MNRCILKALGNPGLNGVIAGLQFKEGKLEYNTSMFPCCEASSIRYDESSNTQLSCDLKKRFKAAEQLYLHYFKTWPKSQAALPHEISANRSSDILRKAAAMIKGVETQATVIKGLKSGPSILWSYALCLGWRFNHRTHIYTIGKTAQSGLLPKDSTDERPLVILIENVHKLWDSKNKEDLELLIQYAYNSNANLILEVKETINTSTESANAKTVSSVIQRKINKLKDKPYWEYLSQDSISRLKTMCYLPKKIL